jgi:GTP pyrophosphokinase
MAPTIDDILKLAGEYLPKKDITVLQEAYDYAKDIHKDKVRISGDSYLSHVLEVTNTLATMRLDRDTLIAGLLHGVLKYSNIPNPAEDLKKRFGSVVATIVDGNTKITAVQFNSELDYQAGNVRKMLMAMAEDVRVLLVKLADRLHDMQTLQSLKKGRQLEVARETMDLYAPLASRLGIDWLKRELEDLAFSFMHPQEYENLAGRITSSTLDRQAYVDEVKKIISKELKKFGLKDFRILGRPKHLYSIYKKIIAQNIPLEKVYDKVAFRVILKTIPECYETLGVVHALWRPISGRFKDFISTPKSNMYQSLHTTVIGPYGEFMEVQIRTEEMDEVAKEGVAAHWAYKEKASISQKDAKLFQWLKQLIQTLGDLEDPKEFLDTVKTELHSTQVYVLTPNGEVKELPQGSTPLDFAFNIHTEVGLHCSGAKVNNRIVPLKYQLKNGDLLEIITTPNQWPNRGWLSLVKTGRARSRIRSWLNKEEQERSLKLGKEICERELRKYNISVKKIIKTGHLKEILKQLSCNTSDELFRKIGAGKITIPSIVRLLQPDEYKEKEILTPEQVTKKAAPKKKGKQNAIVIDGIDDILVKISNCCMPVPGDDIMGFITSGHGISVHKANCQNLLVTDPERWIDVTWSGTKEASHRAQIQITAQDNRGLLATLSNAINQEDANIINVEAHTSATNMAIINMVVEISNLNHLAKLLQHLQQLDGIYEAKRR